MPNLTLADVNAATPLLDLLSLGFKVVSPEGYYLTGDPSTGYIEVGSDLGSAGLLSLDPRGVAEGLKEHADMRTASGQD